MNVRGIASLTLISALILSSCGAGPSQISSDTNPGGAPRQLLNAPVTSTPLPTTIPPVFVEPAGTFRYAVSFRPTSMDPHLMDREFAMAYLNPIYDGLVNEAPDGSIQPGLASSWQIKGDEIVFNIRPDVRFHDGTQVTAEAVRKSIVRGQESPTAYGRRLRSIAHIDVLGERTLRVRLNDLDGDILHVLARQTGMIISPNVSDEELANGAQAGTGPYKIESFAEGQMNLVLHEDYWNPADQGLERIEISWIDDGDDRREALLSGRFDAVGIRPIDVGRVEGAGFSVASHTATVTFITITDLEGESVPELADIRVRKAIAHSINYDEWSETVEQGVGERAVQIFDQGSPWWVEDFEPADYDPDLARELLIEADALETRLTTSTEGILNTGNGTLRQMLIDSGLRVGIERGTVEESRASLSAKNDVYRLARTSEIHPDTFWERYLAPDADFNPFGAGTAVLSTGRDNAAGNPRVEVANFQFRQILQEAYESYWIIPVWSNPHLTGYNPDTVDTITGQRFVVDSVHFRSTRLKNSN